MNRKFVVVSGVPGSGKSWLAGRLAPFLDLPVIDKDDILERLFNAKGVGGAGWRRALSRESDVLFRGEAERSEGALLVSFWRLPGMPSDSGTQTEWLHALSSRIVNLYCECPPAVAAARYSQRVRHPGHLDYLRSREEVVTSIQRAAEWEPLEFSQRVKCDTSLDIDLSLLAPRIYKEFEKL